MMVHRLFLTVSEQIIDSICLARPSHRKRVAISLRKSLRRDVSSLTTPLDHRIDIDSGAAKVEIVEAHDLTWQHLISRRLFDTHSSASVAAA